MKITKRFFRNHISSKIINFLSEDKINHEIIIDKYVEENLIEWLNEEIFELMTDKQTIIYIVFVAEQVIYIFEKERPDDERPRKAIEAAKKYIEDPSEENRKITFGAAREAYFAAEDTARSSSIYHAADAASYAAYYAASNHAGWAINFAFIISITARIDIGNSTKEKIRQKIFNYGINLLN